MSYCWKRKLGPLVIFIRTSWDENRELVEQCISVVLLKEKFGLARYVETLATSGPQKTWKIKRSLAQKQANEQKQDGGGGAYYTWGEDFSMKGGKPSYRIYIYEWSLANLCESRNRAHSNRSVYGLRDNRHGFVTFPRERTVFFKKNRCGRADCYQHDRSLLMVRFDFSHERIATIDSNGIRMWLWVVSVCVSTIYMCYHVIRSLYHCCLSLITL